MKLVNHLQLLAISALFTACANTGGVTVRSPMAPGTLGGYKSAAVNVSAADPSATNSALHVTTLQKTLLDELRSAGVFSTVTSGSEEPADLRMNVTIVSTDGGDSLAQAMSHSGEASCVVSVDLVDTSNQSIAKFDATGNTKSNTSTSIGGVNTAAMSDQALKALEVVTGHIVDYLKKHK